MDNTVIRLCRRLLSQNQINSFEYVILQMVCVMIFNSREYDNDWSSKIGDDLNIDPGKVSKTMNTLFDKGIIMLEEDELSVRGLQTDMQKIMSSLPEPLASMEEQVDGEKVVFADSYRGWLKFRRRKDMKVTPQKAQKELRWLSDIENPILSIERSIKADAKNIFKVGGDSSNNASEFHGFIWSKSDRLIPVLKDKNGLFINLGNSMRRISKNNYRENKI